MTVLLEVKLAVRNVLRQKRRTIFTVLAILGGFGLSAASIGWADGTYRDIIDLFTRSRTGHIQIHAPGYLDQATLYKTIEDYRETGAQVDAVDGVAAWAPRIYAGGLASVAQKSSGVRLIGIDPRLESAATRFENQIAEGGMLAAEASRQALLGRGLAAVLDARIGDDLILVSQGADGSIANDRFRIAGIVATGDRMTDRMSCYLHLADAQEFLYLPGQVHELAVIAASLDEVPRVTGRLRDALGGRELDIQPWTVFAKSFYRAMKADMAGMWIMLFVILLVVAVIVLNTVLMSVLERRREYGVLRALGTRPRRIVRMVLLETTVLTLVAMVLGAGLGAGLIAILSRHGIALPQPVSYGGMEFDVMRAAFTPRSLYLPAVTVLLTALVISFFPARKAARTEPAQAMRTH
ncbi:MAG: FtsX-like permease family protein [Candidatus Eisenbacteria bacterium]|nr:FtsX-like permease family protein [Candidatus Eisenbacteria bacterium]